MWPFEKQKSTKPTDSEAVWSVAKGEIDGAPMFIRFRQDPRPHRTGPAYAHRIGFAVPLRDPDAYGLPQRHEFEELSRIEDLLTAALEAEGRSIHVLSITTKGMREFVFYSSDPDGVRAALPSVRAQIRSHELQWYVEPDPDWRAYQNFIPAN